MGDKMTHYKAGDTIYILGGYSGEHIQTGTVKRVSDTNVITVNHGNFRLDRQDEFGRIMRSTNNSMYSQFLYPTDHPYAITKVAERHHFLQIKSLQDAVTEYSRRLTTESLDDIQVKLDAVREFAINPTLKESQK